MNIDERGSIGVRPSYVLDADMRKGLREPFDPKQIGKLPKPTKKENPKGKCDVCKGWHGLPAIHVDFVGHAAVTDRLNKVAPDWTWEPFDRFIGEDGHCWIHGTITIGGVTRHEYGDGKDPKEAVGNLIRRGAMRFGVAIDLWSKEELEDSSDVEPVPAPTSTGDLEGPQGDGKADEDGSGAPASGPVSGELAYGEGASSPDRPGDQTPPAEGAGDDSRAPSSRALSSQVKQLLRHTEAMRWKDTDIHAALEEAYPGVESISELTQEQARALIPEWAKYVKATRISPEQKARLKPLATNADIVNRAQVLFGGDYIHGINDMTVSEAEAVIEDIEQLKGASA